MQRFLHAALPIWFRQERVQANQLRANERRSRRKESMMAQNERRRRAERYASDVYFQNFSAHILVCFCRVKTHLLSTCLWQRDATILTFSFSNVHADQCLWDSDFGERASNLQIDIELAVVTAAPRQLESAWSWRYKRVPQTHCMTVATCAQRLSPIEKARFLPRCPKADDRRLLKPYADSRGCRRVKRCHTSRRCAFEQIYSLHIDRLKPQSEAAPLVSSKSGASCKR